MCVNALYDVAFCVAYVKMYYRFVRIFLGPFESRLQN